MFQANYNSRDRGNSDPNVDPHARTTSHLGSHISLFTDTTNGLAPGGTLGTGTVMLTATDSGFESNNLYDYSESNYNPSNSLRNTTSSQKNHLGQFN